jgi:hypothetical protein
MEKCWRESRYLHKGTAHDEEPTQPTHPYPPSFHICAFFLLRARLPDLPSNGCGKPWVSRQAVDGGGYRFLSMRYVCVWEMGGDVAGGCKCNR